MLEKLLRGNAELTSPCSNVKKHIEYREAVSVPEEEISPQELKELRELRAEAIKDYNEGKTTSVDEL